MDLSFLARAAAWAQLWWLECDALIQFALAVAVTVLPLLALSWYALRRGLGHVRHRGRWYRPREWALYLAELERMEAAGRPMNWHDAFALDVARYGRRSALRQMARASARRSGY